MSGVCAPALVPSSGCGHRCAAPPARRVGQRLSFDRWSTRPTATTSPRYRQRSGRRSTGLSRTWAPGRSANLQPGARHKRSPTDTSPISEAVPDLPAPGAPVWRCCRSALPRLRPVAAHTWIGTPLYVRLAGVHVTSRCSPALAAEAVQIRRTDPPGGRGRELDSTDDFSNLAGLDDVEAWLTSEP
jgi:hypothetical protein